MIMSTLKIIPKSFTGRGALRLLQQAATQSGGGTTTTVYHQPSTSSVQSTSVPPAGTEVSIPISLDWVHVTGIDNVLLNVTVAIRATQDRTATATDSTIVSLSSDAPGSISAFVGTLSFTPRQAVVRPVSVSANLRFYIIAPSGPTTLTFNLLVSTSDCSAYANGTDIDVICTSIVTPIQ